MKELTRIEKYLNKKYDFRHNEVLERVEYKLKTATHYELLQERQLNSIFLELIRAKLGISKDGLSSLLASDFVTIYNPFLSYFELLPAANDTQHIELLTQTLETHDTDFFKWAFTKWLVAWVAGMVDPKVTNHQCIILAGRQGIGKSRWLENLIPPEWLDDYYYAGNIKIGDKDTLVNLSSKSLINLDELVNMTYSSVSALKELVTKSSISLRKAYGVYHESFVRRASFAGSVNGQEFLYDLTGNRRFLSFDVYKFANEGVHGIDMNLVLAEAYSLYKNGFKFWFDQRDIERVEQNNERFMVLSPEEVALLKNYSPLPLSKRNPELCKAALSLQRTEMDLKYLNRFNSQMIRIKEQIEELDTPCKKLAKELYKELTHRSGNQGELGKLGKILTKYGFKGKRTNLGVEYELYTTDINHLENLVFGKKED